MSADYERVTETPFLELRKCRTCEGAKPLRDTGALAEAVGSVVETVRKHGAAS